MKQIAAWMIVVSAGFGLTVLLVTTLGIAGTLLTFGVVAVLVWSINRVITGGGKPT